MRRLLTICCGLFLTAGGVAALEAAVPQAQGREPGTYYRLFTLEFEPSKTDEGLEIIYGSLVPA